MRTIEIGTGSTVVTNVDVESAITALAIQIYRDFEPADHPAANLCARGRVWVAPESILILDDTRQAGALGFHTLARHSAAHRCCVRPHGDAGRRDVDQCAVSRSAGAAGRPMDQHGGRGNLAGQTVCIGWETCDAVEGIGYKIRDVELSNFVLPRWFVEKVATATRYDFLGQLAQPCTLLPGGYIGLTYDLTTWHVQESGSGQKAAYRATVATGPYSRLPGARKLVV